MGSRTVSLEASAYERLKAAKTPGRSFSEAINRIRAPSRPTYRQLSGLLTPSETKSLKAGGHVLVPRDRILASAAATSVFRSSSSEWSKRHFA